MRAVRTIRELKPVAVCAAGEQFEPFGDALPIVSRGSLRPVDGSDRRLLLPSCAARRCLVSQWLPLGFGKISGFGRNRLEASFFLNRRWP